MNKLGKAILTLIFAGTAAMIVFDVYNFMVVYAPIH